MATIAFPAESRRPASAQPAQLLYVILLAELAGSVRFALLFGFRTTSISAFIPQLYCLVLIACGPLCRRIELGRLGAACETVGFLYGRIRPCSVALSDDRHSRVLR